METTKDNLEEMTQVLKKEISDLRHELSYRLVLSKKNTLEELA